MTSHRSGPEQEMPPRQGRWYPVLCVTALVALGCAREHTAEQSGEVLYGRYCASCHGLGGRGDGPVAPVLVPPPTDLTRLTHDVPELMRLIDGRRSVRAHGTSSMPVWGEVLEASLISEPHARRTALLHVRALADYVYNMRGHER